VSINKLYLEIFKQDIL